ERGRRAAAQRRQPSGEREAAAWSEGGLRLKMVDRVVGVLAADAQPVRSLQPAQVADCEVLVVAELEGVRDVGIPDRREPADGEARIAPLQAIGPVGARNAENVEAIVLVDVDVLRA